MTLLEARRMFDEAVRAFVQAVTTPPAANEGTVVGGIGASLAVLFGAGAARLWVAVLVLMLADLLAGLLRALVRPDEEVSGAAFLGGFLGKLLLLLLVPAAGGVDAVAALLPKLAEFTDGLPATTVVLCALILHESASIVQNVKRAKGDLPVIQMVARIFRESKP